MVTTYHSSIVKMVFLPLQAERMVKRFGVHSAATSGVKVLEKLLLEQKQPRFRYAHFWPRNVF